MVILLGTLTPSRGIALGVPIGFFFLGNLVPVFITETKYFTPWKLMDIAVALNSGAPFQPDMLLPISFTAAWIAIFVAGALWRMEELEI